MATVTLTQTLSNLQVFALFPLAFNVGTGLQTTRIQNGALFNPYGGTLTGLSFVVQWWAGGTSAAAQIGLQRQQDGADGSTAGILSTPAQAAGAFYTDTIDAAVWVSGSSGNFSLNLYAINGDVSTQNAASGTVVCIHANFTYSVPDAYGTGQVILGHVIPRAIDPTQTDFQIDKTYSQPAFTFTASGNRLTPVIPLNNKFTGANLEGGFVAADAKYADIAANYPALTQTANVIGETALNADALLLSLTPQPYAGLLLGNPGDYMALGNPTLPYNPPGLNVSVTWKCADGLPLQNRAIALFLVNASLAAGVIYTWTDKNGLATFPTVFACCTGFEVGINVDLFGAFGGNSDGCTFSKIVDESFYQYQGQATAINFGCASGAYTLFASVAHDPTLLLTKIVNVNSPSQQILIAPNASVLVHGIYDDETLITDASGLATFTKVDPNTIKSGEITYQQVPVTPLGIMPNPVMDVAFRDSSPTGSNRYLTQCPRTFLWIEDFTKPDTGGAAGGNALEISQAQNWLTLGGANAFVSLVNIGTYNTVAAAQPGPLVTAWIRFRSLPRFGTLVMLGRDTLQTDGSFNSYLFSSGDGGITAVNTLSVPNTTSSLIETTGPEGKLLLFTSDNSGNNLISVQASDDGGQTWGTASACMMGSSQFAGVLADSDFWERGGLVLVSLQASGGTSVYSTSDFGLNFTAVL